MSDKNQREFQFLGKKEVARFCRRLIWSSFCRDAAFDARVCSCVFGIPDSLGQFRGISFVSMYKALFVVVETGFEFRFTATILMSGYTVRL